jgi:hypothetical protein
LRIDPSVEHEMKNSNNNNDWNELWTKTGRVYLQGKLGIVRTYLHQSRYKEAVLNAEYARCERMFSFGPLYRYNPLLYAKFCLCEALAYYALGGAEKGEHMLE